MSAEATERCSMCHKRMRRCVCIYLCQPPFDHSLKLILVQSFSEREHIKNSGILLAGSLVNVQLIQVKIPSHHQPLSSDQQSLVHQLEPLERSPYILLYPSSSSSNASIGFAQTDHNWHRLERHPQIPLVILDLTWKQSKRLLLSVPHLRQAPRLELNENVLHMLETQKLKIYENLRTVRTQHQKRCSTLEAGLAALIQYDYMTGQVKTLSEGLSRYTPIWNHYRNWVQDLSRDFKRRSQ